MLGVIGHSKAMQARDLVPDEETALRIGVAILEGHLGKELVANSSFIVHICETVNGRSMAILLLIRRRAARRNVSVPNT